jgi:hypothetical protein
MLDGTVIPIQIVNQPAPVALLLQSNGVTVPTPTTWISGTQVPPTPAVARPVKMTSGASVILYSYAAAGPYPIWSPMIFTKP